MTLIEVLVGLALLGTLFAAVLLAKANSTRQSATAQRQLRAVALTDQLLARWWQTPDGIPATGEGSLSEEDGFAWRMVPAENPAIESLPVQPVRLEVIDSRLENGSPPILTVDLVLSAPVEDADNE